jgi:tryptophan-rich sensory protein
MAKATKPSRKIKRRFNIKLLVLAIVLCLVVGSSGSIFTSPQIGTWYASLAKPSWTPPNWAFGPVWTTLFILMGISLYIIWNRGFRTRMSKMALALFITQFALNVLWSFLFFALQSPIYGLIGIIPLWIMIAATIVAFYRISRPAAFILIPYLAWVTIATLLNYSLLVLNA